MADNELNPDLPFGDMDIFYERCVFGNEPIPSDFKDDFEGTVNFHRALKEFYGDVTEPVYTDLKFYTEKIYWDGKELVDSKGNSVSKMFFVNRRFFLSGEDLNNNRYSGRLLRKNDFSYRGHVYIDSIPDRPEGYKLFVNRIDGYINNKASKTCLLGLLDYNVKNEDILTFFIPKGHKHERSQDNFQLDGIVLENDGSIEFFNEYNPYNVVPNHKYLYLTAGINLTSLMGISEETLESLHLNLDKSYSKKELKDLGIEIFLTGINH